MFTINSSLIVSLSQFSRFFFYEDYYHLSSLYFMTRFVFFLCGLDSEKDKNKFGGIGNNFSSLNFQFYSFFLSVQKGCSWL